MTSPNRNRQLEEQVLNRVTKEAEAALGGKAMPVMVDDLAIFLHYNMNGILQIGGKCPQAQVPETLRMIAAKLEESPQYRKASE